MSNMSHHLRFTKHFDTLIALVTHLSSTSYKSRTPKNIASALGLNPDEVQEVLQSFPGFFRRSKKLSKEGEHYYTIHLRYARRFKDDDKEEETDGTSEPLTPEELSALFDLISHMTSQEHETSLLYIEIKEENRNIRLTNKITLIAAIISAAAAIIAAVVAALTGR